MELDFGSAFVDYSTPGGKLKLLWTRLQWKHVVTGAGILGLVGLLAVGLVTLGSSGDENDGATAALTASEGMQHACYRVCSSDPTSSMMCHFNFTLTHDSIMTPSLCLGCPRNLEDCKRPGCLAADGRSRAVTTVNGMLPGPAIRVCQGDTVVVHVDNKLGQETTLHWHGIHQRNSPHMDGVPHLTQCPITASSDFTYEFDVPRAGTYFWHSHHRAQRADGVFGGLIVRAPPEKNGHANLYDFDLAEHEIFVMDWLIDLAFGASGFAELPRQILVNGKGLPQGFLDDFQSNETLASPGKLFTPLHEVRVKANYAYRFRLLSNGITMCPIEISIENHSLLVIASDGFDLTPISVQSLVIQAGERYDIVVKADQPVGSYYMKFKGHMDCNTKVGQLFQVALFNYEGTPRGAFPSHTVNRWEEAGPNPPGLCLNPVNIAPGNPTENTITIAQLSSGESDHDPQIIEQEEADYQFYLSYDYIYKPHHSPYVNISVNPGDGILRGKKNSGKKPKGQNPRGNQTKAAAAPLPTTGQLNDPRENSHYLPMLNFICHKPPTSPPMVMPETIDGLDRCNRETKLAVGVDCRATYCECTHWLDVQLGSIVEIVLVDIGSFDASHPFHLHGHSFRVVAMERLGSLIEAEDIKLRDKQGLIKRTRKNAPIKDTVIVADGGYTMLRFRADNPGYWFFHCHVELHGDRGMGLIFQVGERHEIPRPPTNFPTC